MKILGRIGQAALWGCAVLALGGCGPTRLTVKPQIPTLLMRPMPLTVGVRIPKSFAEYVQKESGQDRQWEITLGPGQAEAIRHVTAGMFAHTVALGDQAPGDAAAMADPKLDAIIETTLDSYVYLLPSAGGADYYSATIGYKVSLLAVDGKVLGSWIYEGYGSAPSRGLGSKKGVELVTGLAIRDACANLAAHLPDQELLRDLLAPAVPKAATPPPPAGAPEAPAREDRPSTAPGSVPAPSAGATPQAPAAPESVPSPGTRAEPEVPGGASGQAPPPNSQPAPGAEEPSRPEAAPEAASPDAGTAPDKSEVPPTTGN